MAIAPSVALEHAEDTGIPLADVLSGPAVPCGTCDGQGVICMGWTPGSFMSPPESIDRDCPTCDGYGSVPQGYFCEFEADVVADLLHLWEARRYEAQAGEWA